MKNRTITPAVFIQVMIRNPMLWFGCLFLLLSAVILYPQFNDQWKWYYEAKLLVQSPASATGTITATQIVSYRIYGNDPKVLEKRIPMYQLTFSFADARGQWHSGISHIETPNPPAVGDSVTVLYLPENAAICKISGLRIPHHDFAIWTMLVFPLVGIAFLALSVWYYYYKVKLLRQGILTSANLYVTARQEPLKNGEGETVKMETLYDMVICFTDQHANPIEIAHTAHDQPAQTHGVWLLYHPKQPTNNWAFFAELSEKEKSVFAPHETNL